MRICNLAIVCIALTATACGDAPTAPTAITSADLHRLSQKEARCTRNPDIVVTEEVSFRAALETASPNQTIAVDGMIEVHGPDAVMITTAGVTLTCATPGVGVGWDGEKGIGKREKLSREREWQRIGGGLSPQSQLSVYTVAHRPTDHMT